LSYAGVPELVATGAAAWLKAAAICLTNSILLFVPCVQRATGATKMNEVSSRSHAVCIIIVEKCTTILNATNNTDASAAAAAAAMACDNMGLLMAGGGPSSRKAVAAAAALTGKLQHTIKVRPDRVRQPNRTSDVQTHDKGAVEQCMWVPLPQVEKTQLSNEFNTLCGQLAGSHVSVSHWLGLTILCCWCTRTQVEAKFEHTCVC
jgi:hypothetical protein